MSTTHAEKECYVWGRMIEATTAMFPALAPFAEPSELRSPLLIFRNHLLSPQRFPAPSPSPIHQISFGVHHLAFVTEDGNLYTCGAGAKFELGTGREEDRAFEARRLKDLPPMDQVQCGEHHTVALSRDGDVYTFGWGGHDLFVGGTGTKLEDASKPTKLAKFSDAPVVQIACGNHHTLALTADHRVFVWGRGESGVTGTHAGFMRGVSASHSVPTEIDLFKEGKIKIVYIHSTHRHSGAISDKGVLYTWGNNKHGQIGTTTVSLDMYATEPIPTETQGLSGEFIKIFAAGETGSVCVNDKHEVKWWGDKMQPFPTLLRGDDDNFIGKKMVQLAAGDGFYGAIDVFGQVWLWGRGYAVGQRPLVTKWKKFQLKAWRHPFKLSTFGPGKPRGKAEKIFAAHGQIAVISSKSDADAEIPEEEEASDKK